MAYTLQESYDSSTGINVWTVQGTSWVGMTFTTTSAYDLTKVDLWLVRNGITPGTVYLDIYATSSGLPTGVSLGSTSLNANDFSTSYDWREFVLSAAVTLADATMYALIIHLPDGDASNNVRWLFKSGDGYTGGGNLQSSNSGSTWTKNDAYDGGFKTYSGGGIADYLDAAGSCTISLAATGDAELLDILNATGAVTFSLTAAGDTILSHMPTTINVLGNTKPRLVAIANNVLYYEDL